MTGVTAGCNRSWLDFSEKLYLSSAPDMYGCIPSMSFMPSDRRMRSSVTLDVTGSGLVRNYEDVWIKCHNVFFRKLKHDDQRQKICSLILYVATGENNS